MDWTIEPQIGAGPLKFGMTPEEVAEFLGPVDLERDWGAMFRDNKEQYAAYKGSVSETRIFDDVKTMKPTVTYKNKKLEQIELDKAHKPAFAGIVLTGGDRLEVIRKLYDLDVDVFANHSSIVFCNLGIKLTQPKFYKERPAALVFAKGALDFTIADTEMEKVTRRP